MSEKFAQQCAEYYLKSKDKTKARKDLDAHLAKLSAETRNEG